MNVAHEPPAHDLAVWCSTVNVDITVSGDAVISSAVFGTQGVAKLGDLFHGLLSRLQVTELLCGAVMQSYHRKTQWVNIYSSIVMCVIGDLQRGVRFQGLLKKCANQKVVNLTPRPGGDTVVPLAR